MHVILIKTKKNAQFLDLLVSVIDCLQVVFERPP